MDNKNIYDVEYKESNDNNENNIVSYEKSKKKRNSMSGKVVAMILACSIISGLSGAGATYIIMNSNNSNIAQKTIDVEQINFKQSGDNLTVSEVYAKVSPAVVTVSVKGVESFNGWFEQEVSGIGSGFIISEEGNILTNYHVVEGAAEVKVTLSNGTEANATVVNYDQQQDIAMLKIVEDIDMPAVAKLGNSDDLIPGEKVVAIGTPLSENLSQTVTDGIVSAINREVTTEGITLNLIQTNTAINPGNSGGPLVNMNGEVIGINTLKIQGDAEGIGFSIPINDIEGDIETLSKPVLYLGISVQTIDEEIGNQLNIEPGLYIAEVDEFSPAELAGIKSGDRVVAVEGNEISEFEELIDARNSKNEGDILSIEVERGEERKVLNITLATKE